MQSIEEKLAGQPCILQKDFRQAIIDYLEVDSIEIEYYEDFSGIDYIKVNTVNNIFSLFTLYHTEPTALELFNDIFKTEKTIKNILPIDDLHIYNETDRLQLVKDIRLKYDVPENISWNDWPQAMHAEYDSWMNERRVLAFIFKD